MRDWTWTQFIVTFVVAFGLCFLQLSPLEAVFEHLAIASAFALISASLAARYGDRAWNWFVGLLWFLS